MTFSFSDHLKSGVENAYRATEGLMKLADADKADWKPATGENWFTQGELLHHLTGSCGACCDAFANNSWDQMTGGKKSITPEDALQALAEDKKVALATIDAAGEEGLASKMVVAPWSPDAPMPLGIAVNMMIAHLEQHKAQLFYYLKLQGKPVSTPHFWGM